ncbi:YjdJ family protein [Radiobacillus kanasensis]|uniref:YjdJ family protein n=1 Tax=Radiobacillus kanasensis TaxID=2844358 RepID=UPI001E2B1F6E|nr:YjdJ family protein [Radiobacillus kanasensis]UFU01085.1 YjdJ family protein [Radiobacillus kanasensis]
MKYMFSYGLATIVFVLSTFVSWYEGSAIRSDPWEWTYTALFSKWWNGEITSSADIVQLDHFLYAAKFTPIFPFLMFISFSFIVAMTTYLSLKGRRRGLIGSFICIGLAYMFIGIMLTNATTDGGQLFQYGSFSMGFIYLLSLVLFKRHNRESIPVH